MPAAITFDDFFTNDYLLYAKTRKRSWKLDESQARRHISPYFGCKKLTQIKAADIERWLFGLKENGLSPASCNRILAILKSVLILAEKHGYFQYAASPARQVKRLAISPSIERFLSIEEGKKLLKYLTALNCPQAKAIQLLLLTGARKSEILKATWANLDLQNRVLTVPISKSGRKRHIYLSDAAVAIFRSIRRIDDCPWIFPGAKRERPINDIYHFWNKVRTHLGLGKTRLHDLRHTYASYLVAAGHTLYEAQQLLGHSDPRTTMRYAHFCQLALLKAAATVAHELGYGREKRNGADKNSGKGTTKIIVRKEWRLNQGRPPV